MADRDFLLSMYLRVLLGTCPQLDRDGTLCGLCQECVAALGFEHYGLRLFRDPVHHAAPDQWRLHG